MKTCEIKLYTERTIDSFELDKNKLKEFKKLWDKRSSIHIADNRNKSQTGYALGKYKAYTIDLEK